MSSKVTNAKSKDTAMTMAVEATARTSVVKARICPVNEYQLNANADSLLDYGGNSTFTQPFSSLASPVPNSTAALVTHGGGYPAGGGVPRDDDDDYRNAAETASRAAGDSGDSSFFSSLLGSLTQKKSQIDKDDIDEDG